MTQYELKIVADTNDADYVTEITTVTMQEIEDILPVIEAIKNCKKHFNWSKGEYARRDEMPDKIYAGILTEDQIEMFNDYCPYGEYGIHTIESVEYYPLPEKVKLL